MVNIKQMVAGLIQSEGSLAEVFNLTGEVVKKTACKMKTAKSDVSRAFSCFSSCP